MSKEMPFNTMSAAAAHREPTAQSLLNQLTLARARALARAGLYRAAEQLLYAPGKEANSAPEALDLRARILAQQGRFDEAEKLWAQASALEPANAAYVNALRRVNKRQRHPALRRATVLTLVLCLSAVALVFALRRFRAQTGAQPPQEAATQAGKINEPTPSEASGRRQESSPPASVSPDWQALAVDLDVAGTTQSKDTNGVLIEFDEGLFARGTILKPVARERLAQLGSKLKSRADNISIEIIGLTDDLPLPFNSRYKDNIVLGMERARVVYDYLRNSAGLGSQTLTIGSLGEQTEDGSKITLAGRAKRRTVIFRINPRRALPKT